MTNSERTPEEIEAGIDGVGGLVNIYHALTGNDCPCHLALGMATSAVSSLKAERDRLPVPEKKHSMKRLRLPSRSD